MKKILQILVLLIVFLSIGQATVKTWTNGGGTGNWSDASNWDPNGVPANGDVVIFNGTSTDDCNVNVTTNSLANFTMDFDYTGTVHLYANLNVNYSNASFTFINGTFNASSYNITVSGNWDSSSTSATFNRGTSTVNLTDTGTVNTKDDTTNAFYNLKVGTNGETTTLIGGNTATYGTLTVGTGTYTSTGYHFVKNTTNPLLNSGTINVHISYAPGDNNVTIVSTTYGKHLYVIQNGGYTATLGGPISIGNDLYIYPQTVSGTPNELDTIGYDITISDSLFLGTAENKPAFIDSNSSTIYVKNDMDIGLNSYILGDTSTWYVGGSWTSTSTSSSRDMGTSNVTFNGTNQNINVTNTSRANFHNLFIKDGANLTLISDVNLSGSFGDGSDNGTLNMENYTMYVGENWDSSSSDLNFSRGTSTIDLYGTGNVDIRDYNKGFYDLSLAAGGKTTTIVNGYVTFLNQATLGTGTLSGSETNRLSEFYGTNANPLINNGATITAGIYIATDVDMNFPAGDYAVVRFGGDQSGLTATFTGSVSFTTLKTWNWGGFDFTVDTNGQTVTIGSGGLVIGDGTYYAHLSAGSSVIDVNGVVDVKNANSYLQGGTSTWTVGGDWTSISTSANYDMGTSNVTFNGTTQSITVSQTSPANFYNIFIKDGASVTLDSNLNLSGSFGDGSDNGTLNMQSYTIYVGENWDSSSTALDFNRGTSTIDLYGTGTLAQRLSSHAFYNVKVGATGQTTTYVRGNSSSNPDVWVFGVITLGTGTLIKGTGDEFGMLSSLSDPFVNGGGTMTDVILTFGCRVDCNIPGGDNYDILRVYTDTVGTVATFQGPITANKLQIAYQGNIDTGNQNVTVNTGIESVGTSTKSITFGSSILNVNGYVTSNAGTSYFMNDSIWYVDGSWTDTSSSSIWDAGTSNVTFNGTTQSISITNNSIARFYNIFIKDGADVTLNSDLNLSGSFGDGSDSGTLNMGSNTMYVGTNWNSSSSSLNFSRETSTVDLYGTGVVSAISDASNAFYNLKVGASGQTTTVPTNLRTYGQLTLGTGTLTQSSGTRTITMWGSSTDPFVNGGGSIGLTLVFGPSIDYNIPGGTNYQRVTVSGESGSQKLATLQGNIKASSNFVIGRYGNLRTADYNFTLTGGYLLIGQSVYPNYIEAGSSTINVTPRVFVNQNAYILGNTSTWYLGSRWESYSVSPNWDPGTSKMIFNSGTQQNFTTMGTINPFYDIELQNSGTVLYLKNDTQMRSINVSNGTELRIDAVSEAKNLTLYFSDLSGAGFKKGGWSDQYGDLTTIGNWTYRVTIKSNATGIPSNLWVTPTGAGVTLNLSYTTFNYHNTVWMRSNQNDVLNLSLNTITTVGAVFFIGQPVRFENVTIDVGYTGVGTQTNIYNLNNVIILNSFYRDVSVTNANSRLEFNNSNFDTERIVFSASGTAAVISQNHNDVANDYKIIVEQSSSRLKSTITNDFGVNDNVEILNGTFVLDENATVRTILINESATLQIGEDTPTKSVKLEFADVSGAGFNISSSGNLTSKGTATYPIYITSVNEPPTNYWNGDMSTGDLDITMDYTTVSYHSQLSTGGIIEIDNTKFEHDNSTYYTFSAHDGAIINSFNNNTFSNVKYGPVFRVSYATINNLVSTATTQTVYARNIKLEFTNSNFDISKATLAVFGNIVSKNHNDITNGYKIKANTLPKSSITNDFDVNDNVEIIEGTLILDENATVRTMLIDSGTTLQIGEDTPTKSIKLEFADASNAGFNSSSTGTLTARGTATYPMYITSVNEPPTNYWNFYTPSTSMPLNVSYTTISYSTKFASDSFDISNLTMSNVKAGETYCIAIRNGGTITRFDNVSFASMSSIAYALYSYQATYTEFDNVVIPDSGRTYAVYIRQARLEFNNSNFDINDVYFDSNVGSAPPWLISQNHNDIANNYKITIIPGYSKIKSSITNDFTSSDNVEILNGTLVLDENSQSSNFTINSGTSAKFNGISFNVKPGNNMILVNGNLTMNQSTIDFGNNTYGLYINYSNTSIWSSTIFNSSGWDLYLNGSNISATDLSFGGATTTFHARDVAMRNATNPPSTSGYTNVSSFLNITNTSGNSWMNLNVSYTGTPSGEDSLKMYKYTGGTWSVLSNTGVNTTRKVVWATDITSFSIFAPLTTISGGVSKPPGRQIPSIAPAPEMGPTQGMEKFETDLSFIEVVLNLGESLDKPLTLINTGTRDLSITMDKGEFGNYVTLPSSFTLNINGSKTIKFTFYGPELGIKTGIIRIQSDRFVKEVPVVIEVETDMTLFDAKIDIIPGYKEVNAGEDLKAQVSLFRIGPAERMVDVTVTYLIKDLEDNVISTESETFAVLDQVSYTKEFEVPSSLSSGTYVVAIEVMYGSSFATSSAMFVVKGIGLMPLGLMDIVGLILLIVSIVGLITYFKFWKKKKDTSRKSTRRRKFINTD